MMHFFVFYDPLLNYRKLSEFDFLVLLKTYKSKYFRESRATGATGNYRRQNCLYLCVFLFVAISFYVFM